MESHWCSASHEKEVQTERESLPRSITALDVLFCQEMWRAGEDIKLLDKQLETTQMAANKRPDSSPNLNTDCTERNGTCKQLDVRMRGGPTKYIGDLGGISGRRHLPASRPFGKIPVLSLSERRNLFLGCWTRPQTGCDFLSQWRPH